MQTPQLIDSFGRKITYLRMSVTDRCDFRCVYCMCEDMQFLPREQVLSLEEMQHIAQAFAELGVHKIRLTGGEPLVRRGAMDLLAGLGKIDGLSDVGITTNGSQLSRYAEEIKACGVKRLNISLDTLDAEQFHQVTRKGDLAQVVAGIDAAVAAGFEHLKLNAVVMKGRNDDQVLPLVEFARERGIDIAFIEEMPLGGINEHDRGETFCSSDEVQEIIQQRYDLIAEATCSGGPARYYQMPGHVSRIGFISPHSHNFCSSCNRVRLTAEGRLLLCLGQENSVDLRAHVREHPGDIEHLKRVLLDAIVQKPEKHEFSSDGEVGVVRFMNMTGG